MLSKEIFRKHKQVDKAYLDKKDYLSILEIVKLIDKAKEFHL